MDANFLNVFDKWDKYAQKIGDVYKRISVVLAELNVSMDDVRIIAFVNSVWRREIKFFDSLSGLSGRSTECVKSDEKHLREEKLLSLFGLNKEHAVFSFDDHPIDTVLYNEFGMITPGHEEVGFYGVVLQYEMLDSSVFILELMKQISVFCRNILASENFSTERYKLTNLVYTAINKQIDLDFLNTLAASAYERRAPLGGIILLGKTQKYDLKISFKNKYQLNINNIRQIRKILEMTSDGLHLIAIDGNVIGIGDCHDENEFIKFNGHQAWDYYKNNMGLLSYKEGKYTLLFADKKDFIAHFLKDFVDKKNTKDLNDILVALIRQKNGALLIISTEAKAEAARLCGLGRGYAINPIDLKHPDYKMLLPNITSIDGAVFADTDFICYGIGIILDGIAVKAGQSSRGARYNSAKCYIENKDINKYAAIVVSEDDTIDIIYGGSLYTLNSRHY